MFPSVAARVKVAAMERGLEWEWRARWARATVAVRIRFWAWRVPSFPSLGYGYLRVVIVEMVAERKDGVAGGIQVIAFHD